MARRQIGLIFILVTVLIDMIGVGIIVPVIPGLIEELTGGDVSDAAAIGGMLMAAYALMQFLFAPVLGELSDKFGRRPILLISLFGLSIDYFLHAFAPTILWLFIGRLFAGICGASFTTANAYIADIATPESKAKFYGYVGAAFGLGFIIGPAIGGIFGDIDIRLPFYIASGLAMINFLFGLFFVPESLSVEHRREPVLTKMIPGVALIQLSKFKGLGLLIIAFFIAQLAGQVLPAIWPYFSIEMFQWTESEIGYSLMFIGLIISIVQGVLIGPIVKSIGEHRTIKYGFCFWVIGMFLFSLASEPWMLYAFLVPYALGGIAGPTLQGLMSNSIPENKQGNLQGALTSLMSISTIIGPLLATQLFKYFTANDGNYYFPGVSYFSSAILLVIAAIIVYIGLSKIKRANTKLL